MKNVKTSEELKDYLKTVKVHFHTAVGGLVEEEPYKTLSHT